jgi:hypothetical protein
MKLLMSLSLLTLLLAVTPASAQSMDWSMAGSAGIVDYGTSSLAFYEFRGPALAIRSTAIATAHARYPVTNTYGSVNSSNPFWSTFQVTYVDNSPGAVVTATLMAVNACTASEFPVCSITSSDGGTGAVCDYCYFIGGLDFKNNTYYIDATVQKTSTTADPSLISLALY